MSSLLTQTKNKKMKVLPKLSKLLIPLATVVTLLDAWTSVATALTISVLAPDSSYADKTQYEWSALFGQTFLEAPSDNPFQPTPELLESLNSSSEVFFLPLTNDGLTRNVNVSDNQAIFFPVKLTLWIQTSFQGVNTEEPSETATSLCLGSTVAGDSLENPGAVTEFDAFESNPTAQLFASINGQPLPNLFSHRQSCRDQNTTGEIIVEAPGGYQVSTEEDGFLTRLFTTLSLPVGLEHTTVSDGYVVMLEPLSTGTYWLNFGNSDGDESTFVLTVNEKVPEPTSTLNLFVLGIGGIASALTSKLKHRAG